MNTLRNNIIKLIIQETIDELPSQKGKLINELINIYDYSDDSIIKELKSIINYYKNI